MVTVGLDLHKRYVTACALDAYGVVLAEHRRLEPSLDALGCWRAVSDTATCRRRRGEPGGLIIVLVP
jgi:hypothetical protein